MNGILSCPQKQNSCGEAGLLNVNHLPDLRYNVPTHATTARLFDLLVITCFSGMDQ